MPKSKLIKKLIDIVDEQNIADKKIEEKKVASKSTTDVKKKVKVSNESPVKSREKNSPASSEIATKKKTPSKSTVIAKNTVKSKKTMAKNEVSKNKSTDEKTATGKSKASTVKKTATKSRKATAKKTTTKNETSVVKKTAAKSRKTTAKSVKGKSVAKKTASNKKSSVLSQSSFANNMLNNIVEYYDLPYTYDKTAVKVLYQNPTTLFVYWDVSKKDINNFKLLYGENFMKITRPVLIVHNKTNDYTFEISINDFANNWYIHVNDSKCKYEVKLGRRPSQTESIKNETDGTYSDYVEIQNSNTIEMPNDHVLFYKNNQVLTFKNIKDNSISKHIYHIGSAFNEKIKAIYNNYELDEHNNSFDFRNPSSNNPSSNVARKE